MTLLFIILSTVAVSLVSFVGIAMFGLRKEIHDRILLALVGLAAGGLMGSAFLHLLPEALAFSAQEDIFLITLLSFIGFFLVERILHWHHCHQGHHHETHTFGTMSIIGNTIHNFIDGLVIAASFVLDWRLGVTTTLAVILHEIPHEFGDYAILVYAGYSRLRALLLNALTAVAAILGGIIGYYAALSSVSFEIALIPIAAGGFIYVAGSDLIPEFRNDRDGSSVALTFAMFVLGVGLMYVLKMIGLSE
jgi:zinc and cadmium transporter